MQIIAISDLHGHLINITDHCDVVVIAGDWSPLSIQHNHKYMLDWMDHTFIPWMTQLPCSHVVFIAGNHDIICESDNFVKTFDSLLYKHNAIDKIHYLNHNYIIIDGLKFYGVPDTEMISNIWAFANTLQVNWDFDTDTDILITHQPPKFGDLGYVYEFNKDFGSYDLNQAIKNSCIKVNICGHIHTGSHQEHLITNNYNKLTHLFNVSILDEDYSIAYLPTYIEIDS